VATAQSPKRRQNGVLPFFFGAGASGGRLSRLLERLAPRRAATGAGRGGSFDGVWPPDGHGDASWGQLKECCCRSGTQGARSKWTACGSAAAATIAAKGGTRMRW
jgi:hypothetical protein